MLQKIVDKSSKIEVKLCVIQLMKNKEGNK